MYNFSFPPYPTFILLISPLLPIFAVFFLKVSHIIFNWRKNTILLSPNGTVLLSFLSRFWWKRIFFKSQTKKDAYFETSKIVLNSQAHARKNNPQAPVSPCAPISVNTRFHSSKIGTKVFAEAENHKCTLKSEIYLINSQ